MKVYIPCYFNGIKDREVNFYKIIDQYLLLGYELIIVWMNSQDFLLKNEAIKIIKSKPENTSYARNILLKIFYNSNEDYGLFSDDDTFLKTKISNRADCISFVNDFKKYEKETSRIASGLLLIKNFNKYYNKIILFDELLLANQDLDFGINLQKEGMKVYRISTDDVKIYKGQSAMFKNNMNKLNTKEKAMKYIMIKWQKQY